MSEPRKVGACSHCGCSVILRMEGGKREARCSCGATIIRPTFFEAARIGVGMLTGWGRKT